MKRMVLSFIIICISITGLNPQNTQEYKMKIKAVAIPLLAMDKQGNPVLDLKREELKLFINNKEIDFSLKKQEFVTPKNQEISISKVQPIPRLIFLCFDKIFNSREGLLRSLKIAWQLIDKSNDIDQFVILELSMKKGITLTGGPFKKNNEKLMFLLDKINEDEVSDLNKYFKGNFNYSTDLFNDQDMKTLTKGDLQKVKSLKYLKENFLKANTVSYGLNIRLFSGIFERLEYLLKTVHRSKLFFLFSYGMSFNVENIDQIRKAGELDVQHNTKKKDIELIDRKNYQTYVNYLNKMSLAVNSGGSMLFTINSTNEKAGKVALGYMANSSGGKYYDNKDVKKIAEDIQRDISAYYEVFFQLDEKMKSPIKISFKCSREGVKVQSIRNLKNVTDFTKLNLLQKKTFLIDSYLSNNWDKYFNNPKVIPFKLKKMKRNQYHCRINLKNSELGKNLKLYLISKLKENNEFEFRIKKRKKENDFAFEFKKKKNREYFFVLIDLKTSSCYYNTLFPNQAVMDPKAKQQKIQNIVKVSDIEPKKDEGRQKSNIIDKNNHKKTD